MQNISHNSTDFFLNIGKILAFKIMVKIFKEMWMKRVKTVKNMSQRAIA